MSGNKADMQMLLEIQKFGVSFMIATKAKNKSKVTVQHIPIRDVVKYVTAVMVEDVAKELATPTSEVTDGQPPASSPE